MERDPRDSTYDIKLRSDGCVPAFVTRAVSPTLTDKIIFLLTTADCGSI